MVDARLANLRSILAQRELDAFVSLKLVNTYYLSGFTSLDTARPTSYTRPIAVIVDASGAVLIVPLLDEEAAAESSDIRDIRCYRGSPAPVAARALVRERLEEIGAKRIGIEEDTVTADWLAFFERDLPGVQVVPAGDAIRQLRLRKDESEIALLREAARLADIAIRASLASSKPGTPEIVAETDGVVALRQAAAAGGEQAIVDAIPMVLAGARSSMPHEFTTGRPIREGELMWHCWLVSYRGYWVENIRTGVAAKADGRYADAFALLHESLLAGQQAAVPGATAGDVYRTVMKVLHSREVPGSVVLNRAGHGMGLEYHEPPFVEEGDDTVLEPGVVLTVEPGIWVSGTGGYALSNTLVVRDGAAEQLISTPTELFLTA